MKREAWINLLGAMPAAIVAFGGFFGGAGWLAGAQQESMATDRAQAKSILTDKVGQLDGKTMQELQPLLRDLKGNAVVRGWVNACESHAALDNVGYNGNRYEQYVVDTAKFTSCMGNFAQAPAPTAAFTRTQGAGAGFALGLVGALMLPFALWLAAGSTKKFEENWMPKTGERPAGP